MRRYLVQNFDRSSVWLSAPALYSCGVVQSGARCSVCRTIDARSLHFKLSFPSGLIVVEPDHCDVVNAAVVIRSVATSGGVIDVSSSTTCTCSACFGAAASKLILFSCERFIAPPPPPPPSHYGPAVHYTHRGHQLILEQLVATTDWSSRECQSMINVSIAGCLDR